MQNPSTHKIFRGLPKVVANNTTNYQLTCMTDIDFNWSEIKTITAGFQNCWTHYTALIKTLNRISRNYLNTLRSWKNAYLTRHIYRNQVVANTQEALTEQNKISQRNSEYDIISIKTRNHWLRSAIQKHPTWESIS